MVGDAGSPAWVPDAEPNQMGMDFVLVVLPVPHLTRYLGRQQHSHLEQGGVSYRFPPHQ